jgi:hypothetical protein
MVITDQAEQRESRLFLDERVNPVHLSTDHAAMQFIERLGWAISDAEEAEQVKVRRRTPGLPSGRLLGSRGRFSQARSPRARRTKLASGAERIQR